ncbi:MAG: hypothetical protein U9R27_04710 [Campylobacterota bacterium]|nr:hypothetical protein [Campylobacterota bacterium]
MKNSLGKIMIKLTIILLTSSVLYAGGFTSKFTLNKSNPYIKEAVVLTLDLEQTDSTQVMLFKFDIKESRDYEFYRLNIKEEDAYHATKVHYLYLIYPLRSGDVTIDFDLTQMVTTDEKVAFSFSGDRDNIRGLNKTDIPIKLKPIKLKVKALPKNTALVGDFDLTTTIKSHTAKVYEPIHLSISIKGEGYTSILPNIIPEGDQYRRFMEKPTIHSTRSQKGTKSTLTYPIALSAKESFDLASIKINAFDPKSEKSYELIIPKQHFEITKPDPGSMIDKIDSPPPLYTDWGWLTTLLGYMIVFIAGFLSAKSINWRAKPKEELPQETIRDQIKSIDDPKELLALLIATESRDYRSTIEKLESSIYGERKISLKRIKRELESS